MHQKAIIQKRRKNIERVCFKTIQFLGEIRKKTSQRWYSKRCSYAHVAEQTNLELRWSARKIPNTVLSTFPLYLWLMAYGLWLIAYGL